MKTIIVGAGMVGVQLARHLIDKNGDVVLIERDENLARYAMQRLDCLVVADRGNSLRTLVEAGVAAADALVCVTDSDEVNMLVCGLAASVAPNILKIARVRNPDYAELGSDQSSRPPNAATKQSPAPPAEVGNSRKTLLDVDIFVHPDIEAARAIVHAVDHGALGDVIPIGETPFELGSFDVAGGSVFAGLSLAEFRLNSGVECLVPLIERANESIIPAGNTRILVGDRIQVLARKADLSAILARDGKREEGFRRIGVIGGGKIGALVLGGLSAGEKQAGSPRQRLWAVIKPRRPRRLVVIERDAEVCKLLSAGFPNVLVLNEDISDEGFVDEQGLSDLDLIVATTENHELNMITTLYLKSRGVRRAVSLVNSTGYATIARSLGIDVVIPQKTLMVDAIVSHLLGPQVRSVRHIGDGSVSVQELVISPGSAVVGRRVDSLRMPTGILIMLCMRGENTFIPGGDFVFLAEDRVAVIVQKTAETHVERVFGCR